MDFETLSALNISLPSLPTSAYVKTQLAGWPDTMDIFLVWPTTQLMTAFGMEPAEDFVSMLKFFCMACVFIGFSYFLTHHLFLIGSRRYRSIEPKHKQWYVAANIVKSAVLMLECTSVVWIWSFMSQVECELSPFINTFLGLAQEDNQCQMSTYFIRVTSALYVANDLVAMLLVPKLPQTTIIHHTVTCLNLLVIFWFPVDHPIIRMPLLYGALSTLAFPVNGFLALRVIHNGDTYLWWTARISLVIYMLCCIANWSLHFMWISVLTYQNNLSFREGIMAALYLLSTTNLVNDDLILMRWLSQYKVRSKEIKCKKDQ